jgi:hypothetical protein
MNQGAFWKQGRHFTTEVMQSITWFECMYTPHVPWCPEARQSCYPGLISCWSHSTEPCTLWGTLLPWTTGYLVDAEIHFAAPTIIIIITVIFKYDHYYLHHPSQNQAQFNCFYRFHKIIESFWILVVFLGTTFLWIGIWTFFWRRGSYQKSFLPFLSHFWLNTYWRLKSNKFIIWDFSFSQWWVQRWLSSGMMHCVVS